MLTSAPPRTNHEEVLAPAGQEVGLAAHPEDSYAAQQGKGFCEMNAHEAHGSLGTEPFIRGRVRAVHLHARKSHAPSVPQHWARE